MSEKVRSSRRSSGEQSSGRTPVIHEVLDHISAALIFFIAIATPWLFGTTEDWSIGIMNWVCYGLGAVLVAKLIVRRVLGYQPPRWGGEETTAGKWFRRMFFFANLLVLAFCLIAAWNARATFLMEEQRFEYYEKYISWLPFSYDQSLSWDTFRQYLGLFFFFWAFRDWMLGQSKSERRRQRRPVEGERVEKSALAIPILPQRLRTVLWIVCLNGFALALEGILQRLDGTPKLLWLRMSYWEKADSSFGPFSYRSNFAQYINMIWPVCVAFWWMLNEARRSASGKPLRFGEGPQLLLIPAGITMAISPIFSLSRGGAFIAVVSFVMICGLILFHRRTRRSTRISLIVIAGVVVLFSWFLGWDKLAARLRNIEKDNWSNRGEIYEISRQIADDFPVYGTGPGTFRSVYHLYRDSTKQSWHAFVHDDWLETRVTFGWVGMGLVLLNLVLVALAWFVPGKMSAPIVLPAAIWIALGGCLVHARFDFPLQTYSILFLFILLSAILFCLSKRRSHA